MAEKNAVPALKIMASETEKTVAAVAEKASLEKKYANFVPKK